jgi:hypothetical protein
MERRWPAQTILTETNKKHSSRSNARSDHAVLELSCLPTGRFVSFFTNACHARRKKKKQQPLAVSKFTYNTLEVYSI